MIWIMILLFQLMMKMYVNDFENFHYGQVIIRLLETITLNYKVSIYR